jgi:hypothetical protein
MQYLAEDPAANTTPQPEENVQKVAETVIQVASEDAALALVIGASLFAIAWGVINIFLVSHLNLTADQQGRYGRLKCLHQQVKQLPQRAPQ